VALLAMPAGEDIGGGAESLWEEEGISSALVTPLIAFQRVRGVLYADTSRSDRRFSVEDLGLLNLIGCALAVALDSARQQEILSAENRRLLEEINIQHDMVGESPRMREVFRMISKIAVAETTVIIRGESGTGKELAARAIHANSSRAPKPFVAINCAALTETLLESELFGHEKGSFTGAIAQKKGKIELAQGGSLFLDEVGEMALTLQAKLLRVLQEREFERVGGTKTIQADIRLITATNRNLEEEVRAGMFRQDLYYRLNVVSLNMPALRERREDIPLLANFFVRRYSERCKRGVKGIAPEARVCLMHYDWPGNVRELENAVERAVVLGSTDLLLPEDLPEAVLEVGEPEPGAIPRYHEAVLALKKQLIVRAFEQAGGSYTEAARALGVHPNYLHRLIRNMNLKLELTQRSGK
jgi:two-component system, NtrC family, response regulator HydG